MGLHGRETHGFAHRKERKFSAFVKDRDGLDDSTTPNPVVMHPSYPPSGVESVYLFTEYTQEIVQRYADL
jgi:hypothetical protein